jgi:hypothetical protein
LQACARSGDVALVEDQVERVQNCAQPLGSLLGVWHPERQMTVLDRLFGSGDAARHRLLGDQEGAGDLGGAQACHGPQGQRDLRGRGDCRVAAHEQQNQGVV